MSTLATFPPPWRPKDTAPVSQFKGNVVAVSNIGKLFGDGIHRAMLSYRFRGELRDDGMCDDLLTVVFNPHRVGLEEVAFTILPGLIPAFGAYLVELFDEKMIDAASSAMPLNPRRHVRRVGLMSYFDRVLCERAFGLTAEEVIQRTESEAVRSTLVSNGALIIGTVQAIELVEAEGICRRLATRLRPDHS